MEEISQLLQKVVLELFNQSVEVELTRTDEQFGDYATNVALRLGKTLGQNPREIAQQIAENINSELIEKTAVAGPGFINITFTDNTLLAILDKPAAKPLTGQVVVAEYSDPNPFKVLHAGHLYTSVMGDAIANLLENAGAIVHRVNFGGDVGLHVAKALWGMVQALGGENPERLVEITEVERADWMAQCYQAGNAAYEDDDSAQAEITAINKQVYDFHAQQDKTSALAQIYWTCREWSYAYFDAFYARIGTTFEKYYPESQTAPLGLETVKAHIGDVYEESNGAIVFRGEPYGLHTRVFINANGLPTYEAKDVGLALKKWQDYHFNKSVIITGNDIVEYMKVVMKSLEVFLPEATSRTTHLTHGQVKLAGGVKMSSRKGNFLRAVDVLNAAYQANTEANAGAGREEVSLGAVKYAFLKQRMGGDIIYDPKESVSLQGNSGPYLQYAFARANSILDKSSAPLSSQSLGSSIEEIAAGDIRSNQILAQIEDDVSGGLEPAERSLVRKLGEYAEVVGRATNELMSHYVCTYLYELAQEFNRFYEHNKVIGDDREPIRLRLVAHYAEVLKAGLRLLGIDTPDKM